MATWTASIVSVVKNPSGGTAAVTVLYVNGGTESQTQVYNLSDPTQLRQIVATQIEQYETIDDLIANPPTGTVLPPTPPPVVTPPDAATLTFQSDLELYNHMTKAVGYGFIQPTNAAYLALLAKLKSEFLPAYLNLLV